MFRKNRRTSAESTNLKKQLVRALPDGESVQGNLSVLEQTSDQHQDLIIPALQAQHHRRRRRELQELPQPREGLRAETPPGVLAPVAHQYVHELGHHDDPPREAQHEGGPEEPDPELVDHDPAEEEVHGEGCGGYVGARVHDALRLQELLDWEVGSIGEDLWDEAVDEDRRRRCDGGGLAEEEEDLLGEYVDEHDWDPGCHQEDCRPLEVDAEHLVLVGAVGLPA